MASTKKDPAAIEHAKTLTHIPWCEDYEKMISGMLYNSQAPELIEGRFRARRLMHKYNTYFPDDATNDTLVAERERLLNEMLGKIGTNPFIETPFNVDYGCNTSIGDNFYANFNLVILDCGMVTIGNRVLFGPNVSIFGATHETGVQSRRSGIEYGGSVTIGDDCWIGGNTTIMPGLTIGKGCTIGAGSVVTRSIPDFSIAIGSPARVVKKVDPVPDL